MDPFYFPLLEKKEIAKDTIGFWFSTAGSGFSFKAGQYINLSIINPKETDIRGNSRSMSIASAPDHAQSIMLSMRKRPSAFKNNLCNLAIGEKIKFLGPFGMFVLPESVEIPIVFLVGGIGSTTVRSMVEWSTQNQSGHHITLFYSNRDAQSSAFLDDFVAWAQVNPNFKPIFTINDTEDRSWKYDFGFIDQVLIHKYIQDVNNPIYYVVGPPEMVIAMQEMLRGLGIIPDKIVTEQYGGY